MGIPPFWQTVDAVETGKTQSIAEWATHHFQSTGKPLRIAIDQPNWWYKTLPDDEEAKIKRSKSILPHSFRTRMTSDSFTDSPGSHPREKRFLERVCYLLARNVQLVFVFDGPNKDKPARGGRVGAGNPLKVKLLRTMLDYLGVPRHNAPGDAEAECAKLQRLGVVDAVWSDDADTLMFGCDTLIRFHYIKEGEKSMDLVDVYTLEAVQERVGLSRNGIVLFALLVGTDFDEVGQPGLRGCGKQLALKLARQHGLTESLAAVVDEEELSVWRVQLENAIKAVNSKIVLELPPDFPRLKVLRACRSPLVSSDAALSPPAFPRNDWYPHDGWFRSFRRPQGEMVELYRFLLLHFFSRPKKDWPAKFLVPIELNHILRETPGDRRAGNDSLAIQLKPKKTFGPTMTVSIEDPLLALPELAHAFEIPLAEQLVFKPIQFDLLTCVLQQGFPNTAFVAKQSPSTPATTKKKSSASTSKLASESALTFKTASRSKLPQSTPATKKRKLTTAQSPPRKRKDPNPSPQSNDRLRNAASPLQGLAQATPTHKQKLLTEGNGKAQPNKPPPSLPVFKPPPPLPAFMTRDQPFDDSENERLTRRPIPTIDHAPSPLRAKGVTDQSNPYVDDDDETGAAAAVRRHWGASPPVGSRQDPIVL